MNGLIPVYKPKDMVSKDVSRILQKLLPKKTRIGHVGTLDPMASGVLPILIGTATRLSDYLLDSPKVYAATVVFGASTDTLDITGKITEEGSYSHVQLADVEKVLQNFIGTYDQVPPIYSAIKHNGIPLYKMAREDGVSAESFDLHTLKRRVTIDELRLTDWQVDRFTFVVRCQKGTYIRSLMRDICEKLEVCGTLGALSREEACGIKGTQAVRLEDITNRPISESMVPVSQIKIGMEKFIIADSEIWQRLKNGQVVRINDDFLEVLEHEGSNRPLTQRNLSFSLPKKQVLLNQDQTENWILATIESVDPNLVELKVKRSL